MFSKQRQAGFTLVEMIIAIVIIGLGLAGLLAALNLNVRSSADPLLRKQMLSVAEEMMEEILLKPVAAGPGTIVGCDRSAADNVTDYAGYNQSVCDIDGTAVSGLSDYNVNVNITTPTLSDGSTGVAALRVEVTVTRGDDSLTLTGWRTDYGS